MANYRNLRIPLQAAAGTPTALDRGDLILDALERNVSAAGWAPDQTAHITLRTRVHPAAPNRFRLCWRCGERRADSVTSDFRLAGTGRIGRMMGMLRSLAHATREKIELARFGAIHNAIIVERTLCPRCELEQDERAMA